MIKLSQRLFLKQASRFAYSQPSTQANKHFISEPELDALLSQNAKVRLGVMALPVDETEYDTILQADDDNFTFYYKNTDPVKKSMQKVVDPRLKALAVQRLKANIKNVWTVPLKYYFWAAGPHNFVDFSLKHDKQKLLDYMSLVEVLPLHSKFGIDQSKKQLREFDGVILTGGMSSCFQRLSKREFEEHYEPDGTPKTYPKYRTPSKVYRLYEDIFSEIVHLNATGSFLPAWSVCMSSFYLPLVSGFSQLNLDTYEIEDRPLLKLRKIDSASRTRLSKKHSLSEMVETQLKHFSGQSLFYFTNDIGYRVQELEKDAKFMENFDMIYTSSITNFESPVKSDKYPVLNFGQKHYINASSLDPEFVAMIEHKKFPIYLSSFYPKTLFRFEDRFKHANMERVQEANSVFSRFYTSMILRNQLDPSLLRANASETPEQPIASTATTDRFENFTSAIAELYPDFQDKILQEFGHHEYHFNKKSIENSSEGRTDSFTEDCELNSLSSMAVADKAIGYYNVGVFWK